MTDLNHGDLTRRSNGGERSTLIGRISGWVSWLKDTFRWMGHADVRPASLAGQLSAPNCIGARCTETAFRWRAVRYDPAGFKFASVVSRRPLTADQAPYLLLASCAHRRNYHFQHSPLISPAGHSILPKHFLNSLAYCCCKRVFLLTEGFTTVYAEKHPPLN